MAFKEYAEAELRISEQQASIEALEDSLDGFRKDLDSASGSAGVLRETVKAKDGEIAEYKAIILSIQKKLREKQKEIHSFENENRALKENLSASEAARCDLTKVCSEHIRSAKSNALENFKEFSERILIEREDFLGHVSILGDLERDVRNAVSKDTLQELHRLREEMFKLRQRELHKDEEIAFLQKQLIEASERLAKDQLQSENHQGNNRGTK